MLEGPALLTLFKFIFDRQPQTFERIGAPMIGLFPLIMMFLITSIAMVRERTTGTLERCRCRWRSSTSCSATRSPSLCSPRCRARDHRCGRLLGPRRASGGTRLG
jgi:hypothetical protein